MLVLYMLGKQRSFHVAFIIFTKFMTTKAKQFMEKMKEKKYLYIELLKYQVLDIEFVIFWFLTSERFLFTYP